MSIEERIETKIVDEFSRFAQYYNSYSVIQSKVAKLLVSKLSDKRYKRVIDIGCGSGEVYKNLISQNISFEEFIAFDLSPQMLELHPTTSNITKICGDFNNLTSLLELESKDTLILSSSALQWSSDLDLTLSQISQISPHINLAIFTSNTFATLHKIAKVSSPIYSVEILKEKLSQYYKASYELKDYKLDFKNTRDMLKYIKKSGVSGGERRLSFRETKYLIDNYPLDYLEFEILFVESDFLV
ncbi:MAG: methyltransferase domain-containing protein [Sulfurovum sp.]